MRYYFGVCLEGLRMLLLRFETNTFGNQVQGTTQYTNLLDRCVELCKIINLKKNVSVK
jgi:hypothetical protein